MTAQSLSLATIVIAISKCLVGNAPYPVFSFMLGQFVFVFIAPILNMIPIEKKCQFLILCLAELFAPFQERIPSHYV